MRHILQERLVDRLLKPASHWRRKRKRKYLHTRTQATQTRCFVSCTYVLSLLTRRFLTQAQSQEKHKKNKIVLFPALALAVAITFFSLRTRFFTQNPIFLNKYSQESTVDMVSTDVLKTCIARSDPFKSVSASFVCSLYKTRNKTGKYGKYGRVENLHYPF